MRTRYIKYKCAVCQRQDARLYRPYSEFYRPERVFCNMHVPSDEFGWYVPLIDCAEGMTIWGHLNADTNDFVRVENMPDAHPAGFQFREWRSWRNG
jgi:hypothetical protein